MMKGSGVIFLTLIILAVTLAMPWTDVEYWEDSDGSIFDSKADDLMMPYLFVYEAANTSKVIRWDYTFVQMGIILLVGGAFYVNPKTSLKKLTPRALWANLAQTRHALMPTPGAAGCLVILFLLFLILMFARG